MENQVITTTHTEKQKNLSTNSTEDLERNRLAALQSRKRKKDNQNVLEKRMIIEELANQQLRHRIEQLRHDVDFLRTQLLSHTGCTCFLF